MPQVWSVRARGLSTCSGLSRLPILRAGCRGPPPTCCERGCAGVGAQHCPLGLHALRGLRAAGVVGSRPRGGGLPPLLGASGVSRCPSPGRPPSGVGSRGSATRMPRVWSLLVCGPGTGPAACALWSWRCALWGSRKGVPGGAAFYHCEGHLRPGAPPLPASGPPGWLSGSVTNVGVRDGGPALSPWLACPVGAACRGAGGGPPPGWWPPTVVRGVWCQALSSFRPPILWGGQPGFRDPCVPSMVGAGVGTQQRTHRVRPCGPALLALGLAEERPRGGCLLPL